MKVPAQIPSEQKCAFFDELYANCFEQNFGALSKTDLELLLFKGYTAIRRKSQQPTDDYTLSLQLGLTQTKVRSLKERVALRYPETKPQWKQMFLDALKQAKYDERDAHIKLVIEDVTAMAEIRHHLEQLGWYDDWTLNRKLLNLPVACFLELCRDLMEDIKSFLADFQDKFNALEEETRNIPQVKPLCGKTTMDKLVSFFKKIPKELPVQVVSSIVGCILQYFITQ